MSVRLLVVASLGLLLCVNAAEAGKFDGAWTVEGGTDVGNCAKTFSGEIQVKNDDIISSSASGAQITGAIDAKGSAWARVTGKEGVARAGGQFRGATASGAWSSNTAMCGGRWKARKLR